MAKKEEPKEPTSKDLLAKAWEKDFYRNVIGMNYLTGKGSPLGQEGAAVGESQYDGIMANDEAKKLRREAQQEYDAIGVAGRASDQEVSAKVMRRAYERVTSSQLSSFGDLEALVKDVAPKYTPNIPEELAVREEGIMKKLIAGEKLTDEEKEIHNMAVHKRNEIYDVLRYSAGLALLTEHGFERHNRSAEDFKEKFEKAYGIEPSGNGIEKTESDKDAEKPAKKK